MCDLNEDKLAAEQLIARKKGILHNTVCMKCKEKEAVVVVRIHDPLCRDCFLTYSTHKFRSTLGKARLVQANDKVLLALSGGHSSMALLHFVREALSEGAHKRLKFLPGVVYVDETSISSDSEDVSNKINAVAKSYGYPFYKVPIYEGFDNDTSNMEDDDKHNFKNVFDSIKTLTAKNDYLLNRRLKQVLSVAINHGYSKIMLGENASHLSMKLLCNVAQGRGATISQDIGVGDYRHDGLIIIRPLREFLSKEIVMYNRLQNVEVFLQANINSKTDAGSCLQRQTEEFINGLQAEFPSTVNTVFRTGDKIVSADGSSKFSNQKCIMCQSPLGLVDKKIEACSEQGKKTCCGSSDECTSRKFNLNSNDIIQLLCYGCRLTFKDMGNDPQSLGNDILQIASSSIKREKMKERIQEFLIDDDIS